MKISAIAARAAAFSYGPWSSTGTLPVPNDAPKDAVQRILNAQLHPNATRSIEFKPFENSWPYTSRTSVLDGSRWKWRVNVSDIDVSDTKSVYNSLDFHSVSTTFDLSWSYPGNISQALDNASFPACIIVISGLNFPVNVTNSYTDENANSTDCAPVIGKDCLDAIRAHSFPTIGNKDSCNAPETNWSDMPECRNSFGYTKDAHKSFSITTTPVPMQRRNSTTLPAFNWASGQAFYTSLTSQQNSSNSLAYQEATNQLQILMMSVMIPGQPSLGMAYADMHCMRVNTTKLPESADLDGDGFTLTSEALRAPKTNAGSGHRTPSFLFVSWALTAVFWIVQ